MSRRRRTIELGATLYVKGRPYILKEITESTLRGKPFTVYLTCVTPQEAERKQAGLARSHMTGGIRPFNYIREAPYSQSSSSGSQGPTHST